MNTISQQRAEKIARNINAFDINYQYSSDMREVRFWSNLYKKLKNILNTLSDLDKEMIAGLCDADNAKYFGLTILIEPIKPTIMNTTSSTSFRKTVMLRAYHIMSTTGKDWSVCLKKAWLLYRLNKELHSGEVTFYFEKKDGNLRKAVATLKIDYDFKTESQPSPKVFTYFDIEANSFRSFKIENFIMIEPIATPKIKANLVVKKTPAKLVRLRRKHLKAA